MEDNDLQRELDRAELRRRNAEADRQEREAATVWPRYWIEFVKWLVAAGGLGIAMFKLWGGGE